MNICVTSPSLINKPLLYPPIKSTSLPLSKAAFKDRKQFPWKLFIKVSWENYLFYPSCPRSKLYTNNAYNAISKASHSSKPIPVSDALRSEISHWLFLDTWTGFLPWKKEKHYSISLFSDASSVGWGSSIRIPSWTTKLLLPHGKNKYPRIQLSQVMKSIFQLFLRTNSALLTFFVPSSANPAHHPSCTLSDIDCRLSPMALTFIQHGLGQFWYI